LIAFLKRVTLRSDQKIMNMKGTADSVVSALTLKRGISALRDFSMDEKGKAARPKLGSELYLSAFLKRVILRSVQKIIGMRLDHSMVLACDGNVLK
jgi:hypothetical protein